MNKIKFSLVCLFLVGILTSSCEKQKVNNPEFAIDTYSDTLQMSGLPSFPASVIHVIHREYILSHPGIVLKSELLDPDYVNHMETRLIQMFPLTAFSGMMDSADYIINNVIASLPTVSRQHKLD